MMNRVTVAMDNAAPPNAAAGPLNSFQKLMRCWTSLAPYNAVQVMKIGGHANLEHWQNAVKQVLAGLQASGCFPPMPEMAPVEHLPPETSCEQAIATALNKPFIPGRAPLRAAILPLPDAFLFILTYDHWIADSWSIRELMRCIYFQAAGVAAVPGFAPLTTGPMPRAARMFGGLGESLQQYLRHRRAARLHLSNPLDFQAGFLSRTLPESVIQRLRVPAAELKVSIHDIFVAVLASLLGEMTRDQRCQKRRRFGRLSRNRVAIGSIVDIRKYIDAFAPRPGGAGDAQRAAAAASNRQFGVALGFTTTLVPQPEAQSIRQLIRTVHQQHQRQKQTLAAVKSLDAMDMTRFFWNLYRQSRHHAYFFSKNLPLLAGISNINLADQWMCSAPPKLPPILNYFRVSPVGPLLPVVWATTTFRDRLTIGLTYRRTAIDVAQAAALVDKFAETLERLPETLSA